MFTIDFNPTLFELGPFEIRYYSLFYLLGFFVLFLCIKYFSRKGYISLDTKKTEDFLFYVILGLLIGARAGYFLFYEIGSLFSLELFKVWHGGMSFHGGLIGTIAAVLFFSKKHKKKFWPMLNITAVAAAFSLMLGRIGNFINGELVGTKFNGPWCAVFVNYDNACRHPYPIYASVSHLILLVYLGVLLYINRERIKEYLETKMITVNFLIGYGLLRIITDIWKVDNVLLGVKMGQWLSILMIIFGIWLWKKKSN